ncbi:MAG: zinc ribbon domain-containing protein [Promethearchaeota archaeon]
MYCSKCGEKLSNANQNFCHNCGAEVPNHYKTTSYKTPSYETPSYETPSYKTERPQYEPSPQVYYVPVKYSKPIQKGLPGKNSKLCLGLAISSIIIGIVSLMIGYYSNMFFYYPYDYVYFNRRLIIVTINIFLRAGGLILGIFSKYNSSKAGNSEPYNDFEKAGSIIGILGIITNAIGLFLLVFGPYSLIYYVPYY